MSLKAQWILQQKLVSQFLVVSILAFAQIFSAGVAKSDVRDEEICLQAAFDAAQAMNVPYRVLAAITLVETGRELKGVLRSWPWAINNAGEGYWLENKSDALRLVRELSNRGETNIDTGCFQLNLRWHRENFASIEAMIDPFENAKYAAAFLQNLYNEHGTWLAAVGAYHSRNEKFAARYRAKFSDVLNELEQKPEMLQLTERMPAVTRQEAPRVNHFPFLVATDGYAGIGSLVPVLERHPNALIKVN